MCTIIEEEWRDIAGYEGIYQVSNLGRVKSLYKGMGKERYLKPIDNGKGYLHVYLSLNGAKRPFIIHRLVATTFIPNPNEFSDVNHKDEDKSNNKVSNLEWVSHIYNCNYGTRNDRIYNLYPRRKCLCIEIQIEYESLSLASKATNVDLTGIWRCCQGRNKSAGGYHWKYSN